MHSIRLAVVAAALVTFVSPARVQTPTTSQQIEAAVLPLPESIRAEATVVARGADGRFIEVRRGENELVCEVENPKDDGVEFFCYHESMFPLRSRNRDLEVLGLSRDERRATLEPEVAGRIPAPTAAVAYLVRGPSGCYKYPTKTLCTDAEVVYMVYTPMMTSASLGLPPERVGTVPYMHAEGSLWAHVMIEPAAPIGRRAHPSHRHHGSGDTRSVCTRSHP